MITPNEQQPQAATSTLAHKFDAISLELDKLMCLAAETLHAEQDEESAYMLTLLIDVIADCRATVRALRVAAVEDDV